MKLRVIFFGTPRIAVPFLNQVFETEQVVGVVTRQDKPSGRGHHVRQSPVAEAAHGKVEIRKPVKLKDPDFYTWIDSLKPDLCIVVAYGRILPEKIISVPRMGCLVWIFCELITLARDLKQEEEHV